MMRDSISQFLSTEQFTLPINNPKNKYIHQLFEERITQQLDVTDEKIPIPVKVHKKCLNHY